MVVMFWDLGKEDLIGINAKADLLPTLPRKVGYLMLISSVIHFLIYVLFW